jgi:rhodanese-related sulfurtransferase
VAETRASADTETLLRVFREYLASIPPQLNYILPADLAANRERYFILDNRTPEAYAEGHIPGSVNIWMKDLLEPDQLARLPRDKTIAVCCWVGHTASQLLPILFSLGFDAVGLKYGMGSPKDPSECRLGWVEQEFPVQAATRPPT